MTDCFLESEDVRRGFISGRTFEVKPIEYAVVLVEDPDTGESINLAVYEGCIVLGTAEEMDVATRRVEAAADAAAAGGESSFGLDYEALAAAAPEGSEIQNGVGITGHGFRWPNGIVPYEIHSSLPNQARVTDTIAHWQQKTRIRFVQRTSANASRYPNYVRVIPSNVRGVVINSANPRPIRFSLDIPQSELSAGYNLSVHVDVNRTGKIDIGDYITTKAISLSAPTSSLNVTVDPVQ